MIHHDHQSFVSLIHSVSARSLFSASLIEKDYFLSVILSFLSTHDPQLIFKGGTSLNKMHVGFYRLSEDLDFCISTSCNASRTDRSRSVSHTRKLLNLIPQTVKAFRLLNPLRGYNNSHHYTAVLSYLSAITNSEEFIKVEISLRESILEPTITRSAATLLFESVERAKSPPLLTVKALTANEAFAEKVRAALTRPEPAIRDFFDIDYAHRIGICDFTSSKFIALVRSKLAHQMTTQIRIREDLEFSLRHQLNSHLRPVLRESDFQQFQLHRPIRLLETIVKMVNRL